MKVYLSFVAAAAFCFCTAAHAASEEGEISTRAGNPEKKYGLYLGIGNPYPTLIGVNAAYNISPNLRASLGYGQIDVTSSMNVSGGTVTSSTVSAKTYGAGVEYLFLETHFRPITGLHAGYLQVSGDGDISLNNLKKNSAFLYANAGFDWLTNSGFQLGAGVNVNVAGGSGAGIYLNSGYFF